MSLDINTKKLKKNAFRVVKQRGMTASRIRVPGGYLKAEHLARIQEIAEKFGNGNVQITARQGFELPGIKMEDIPKVNELLQPIIAELKINQETPGTGYDASGTRNVTSCVGNKYCPYGNYNTTQFAKRVEKVIFPSDLHVKIALTGCANDCIKARMHDFGIIGMTEPQYEKNRCVACGACIKACKRKSADVLKFENHKVVRNEEKCIGCGECVMACPTSAWTRSEEKYYRLVIMGRTGKKNPRIAEDFAIWIDEDSIVKMIENTYDYVEEYIDRTAPGGKEHIGYIVDRTGFMEFKKWAMKDVNPGPKAVIKDNVYWSGVRY